MKGIGRRRRDLAEEGEAGGEFKVQHYAAAEGSFRLIKLELCWLNISGVTCPSIMVAVVGLAGRPPWVGYG